MVTDQDKSGRGSVDERVKKLEERLDKLLSGKIDLEVVELGALQVSPKSKLRVACE
ncbi:hypothetical protein [Rhizobium sp. 10PS4]|uniref:hypothetical protein n=1 Tax=Rhizobium sp. 10PS4 TaxID=3075621 RepID=UPI0028FD2DB5|nr:hypothetical protein [Rhizobium sp. 10PS4]MDU0309431.1 hypothetical protein [Rhizobium sp. 10PS4]